MRKVSHKDNDFAGELHGGIFLAFCYEGRSEGLLLSAAEFTRDEWTKQLPKEKFSCKVIGAPGHEQRVREILDKVGATLQRYVARDSGKFRFDPTQGTLLVEKVVESAQQPVSVAESQHKISVMIVDDSKTIRNLLRKVFSADTNLVVVADFADPALALSKAEEIKPDVITLDIHMPGMNGIDFLKRLMTFRPIPTVMISSISMDEGPMVLNALEAGAVDYIQKPSFAELNTMAPLIIEKVKVAASARMIKFGKPDSGHAAAIPRVATGEIDKSKIIAIGASTGGTEALREILIKLPAEIPPILIVQHIPPIFSRAFAERMNRLCAFEVREAADGDLVQPNRCYVAPGGMQMSMAKKSDGSYYLAVIDGPPVNRHKPSVDVLFYSVAALSGKRAVGVILTGMGADGAQGLLSMKNAGAPTFGQNEETCVVYGMPKAANKIGAVGQELPLNKIPDAILANVLVKRNVS